ncbi:MAG: MarR family transcriptional regulator [Saprospiraceae bacterium]|nr:MarR family transcriptional regulator [Saprospiraceae bacterium]MDW8228226.1 MarR family transcriptional regulator [Saprospiraceae bacterium]
MNIEKRLEESLILRLIAVGEALKRRRDKICQELGISAQQWLILLHLAKDPNLAFFTKEKHRKPMLASEIARSLDVSRPNVTKLLNVLMEKGLIEQVKDRNDQRRKRIELSATGHLLVESLQPMRLQLNEQLFESFDRQEMQTVLRFLDNCLSRLDEF